MSVRVPATRFALKDRRGRALEIDEQRGTVVNPRTGRHIRIDGATYDDLVQRGDIVQSFTREPERSSSPVSRRRAGGSAGRRPRSAAGPLPFSRDRFTRLLPRSYDSSPKRRTSGRGCGNAKRYTSKDEPFCGEAGGSCPNTYPVGTRRNTIETLQRARYAPDPAGVRACARLQQIRRNWAPRTGTRRASVNDYDFDDLRNAWNQYGGDNGAKSTVLGDILNPRDRAVESALDASDASVFRRPAAPANSSFFRRFFGLDRA